MLKKNSLLIPLISILFILGISNIIFAYIKLSNLYLYLDQLKINEISIESKNSIEFAKVKVNTGIKFYNVVLTGGKLFLLFSFALLFKIIKNSKK